jgi:hypothetical protein
MVTGLFRRGSLEQIVDELQPVVIPQYEDVKVIEGMTTCLKEKHYKLLCRAVPYTVVD